MAITVPAANSTGTSAWADSVANWINARTPVFATNTTNSATTTTTEVKDTGIGDVAITVTDATAWYRIKYIVRATSDAAATTMDTHVRDGGSSSPTNTSTLIAGASIYLAAATGAGACALTAEAIVQFSIGTHNLAGFFLRTAGTGNVSVTQSTGGQRILSIEQIT